LETWSGQGSITQSSETYATIRRALVESDSPYKDKQFDVFLQGSYGNDTNIYSESDVDIVIRYDSAFKYDISQIPPAQQAAFHAEFSAASYDLPAFKEDVIAVLRQRFGRDVEVGNKAISIKANNGRRKADVIATYKFRGYSAFPATDPRSCTEGICFNDAAGNLIKNYPKLHSANCTQRHQDSGRKFKPVVRILKNMRRFLEESDILQKGVAPSYFLEGMLYNVPLEAYAPTLQQSLYNCLNWLGSCDKDQLVCANRQYWLLRGDASVTWNADKMQQYLVAVAGLWDNWYND
jgi:hypothetical protein